MRYKEQKEKPYRNDYLIYNRKSTDDLDNQKNSLKYQELEGLKYAKLNKLSIAKVDIPNFCNKGIINESHTGFKEDNSLNIGEDGRIQYRIERPKFEKLVHSLLNGEFKGVIFLCWDRASRNKNDDNIIRKMMKMSIEIRFVQARYDDSSSGELHMDVDGMFAQHHSRVTSEKVRNTNKKMRSEGICTYRAPIGYLNTGDPRNKPFDPERAPLVKQLFEKYVEGTWSLADLARWANDNGLTTKPVRRKRTIEEMLSDERVKIEPVSRPLTFNHIHKILTNLFYVGKVLGNNGVYVDSVSHKALVNEDVFHRVQGLLNTKKVSIHYKDKLYFPYRGLIRCYVCDRVYTPYKQKGIDYYGARCVVGCTSTNRSINADFIENKVGSAMFGLSFTEEERIDIDNQVRNEISTLEDKRIANLKVISQEKRKLRDDLSYLRKNKLTLLKNRVYTGEDYLKEESKLTQRIEKLHNEEEASDVSMQEVVRDVVFLSELLEDAYLYYVLANPTEKQQIIRKIFSELTLSGETLHFKCKNGFKVLENKKSFLGEDKCTTSELNTVSSSVKAVVTEGPSVDLYYDSNNKESNIIAKATVRVTAGGNDFVIEKPRSVWPIHAEKLRAHFFMNLQDSNGRSREGSLLVISSSLATLDNGDSWTVKAGKTGEFILSENLNVKQMFAGSYHAVPALYFANNSNTNNILNTKDGNYVTIVGETSPYIISVSPSSEGVGSYVIEGLRFAGDFPRNPVYNSVTINGRTKQISSSPTKLGNAQIYFNLNDFRITKSGNYMVQVTTNDGASNQFETIFNVDSTQSPVIYSVNGKGGFGSGNGDSNSIYGENLINIKEIYLESVDGKKVSLKFSFPNNGKEIIGITVPDSVRGYYSLFVVNSAGLVSNSYKVGYLGAMVPVSQVPTITSITSVPVKVGDIVEVWGTGLSGISTSVGPGDYGVSVNSSSASDNYFSFVVPSYLNVGEHTLMVEKGVLRSNTVKFTIMQNQTSAPTVTISASPTSVVSGGQSTITWSSAGASGCKFIEGDNQFKNYENTVSGNNRYTQSLYSSQTYTISCVGSGGTTVKSVTVNIGSTPTVSVISPNGGETWSLVSTQNIRWTTTGNISKVRLDLVDVDTGSVRVSGLASSNSDMLGLEYNDGSADIMFPNYIPASQYKIRVTDCSNITLNSQPCVNNNTVFDVSNSYFKLINPINGTVVPTATISASPTIIASGQSTTITWSSTNASQCILGGDFAIGNGVAQYWKGSLTVTPTKQTSTYSVRCTDSMQTVEKVASVTVNTNSPSISPVVSFARSAGFVSQNISPNSTNVKIGSFTIQNSSSEAVVIGTSTVNLVFSGDFNNNTISNLSVRNFGIPVGYVADATSYFFSSVPVTIAPYGTQTFDVYADIGSATNGSVTAGMTVYYSGKTSNFSGSVSATGVAVTPVVSTLANPTLTTSSPVSQFVVGGTNFGIATYRVATEGAGTQAVIRELRFSTTGTDAIMSMTVNGVQGSVVNGNVTISGLSIPISSSGTDIPVSVQFSGFQNSTTGGALQSGVSNVGVTLSYVEAVSGAGSVITKQTSVSSNKMTLVASKPTVTMSGGRTSQVVLSSVEESKIGEFTVTSDFNGKIALSNVTLNFSTTGITGAQFSKVRMSNGSINITTVPNTHVIGSNGSISFEIPLYEISAGQSQTFSVFAVVSGVAQSGISPVVMSRFDSPSLFVWNDIIGGNTRQTGSYIYNFPTSSYSTLSLNTVSGQVLGDYVSCVIIPRNMHRGAESTSVTTLQKFLQSKELLTEVTGFYGDKTIEAVKDYQASKGLPVTGMVYNATRETIKGDTCQ